MTEPKEFQGMQRSELVRLVVELTTERDHLREMLREWKIEVRGSEAKFQEARDELLFEHDKARELRQQDEEIAALLEVAVGWAEHIPSTFSKPWLDRYAKLGCPRR